MQENREITALQRQISQLIEDIREIKLDLMKGFGVLWVILVLVICTYILCLAFL